VLLLLTLLSVVKHAADCGHLVRDQSWTRVTHLSCGGCVEYWEPMRRSCVFRAAASRLASHRLRGFMSRWRQRVAKL